MPLLTFCWSWYAFLAVCGSEARTAAPTTSRTHSCSSRTSATADGSHFWASLGGIA